MSVEIKHRNGGVSIVHDLSVLDDILEADRKFYAESDAFHAKLMAMGVKAYRCNDAVLSFRPCRICKIIVDFTV